MIISERIFEIMKEQKMSQRELSRRTGITISTISDWNTKKSNPASDKLLVIIEDHKILEDYHKLSKSQQMRLLKYMKRLGEMNGEK